MYTHTHTHCIFRPKIHTIYIQTTNVHTHTHNVQTQFIHPYDIPSVCVGVTVYAVSISQWILSGGQFFFFLTRLSFRLKTWETGKFGRRERQWKRSFKLKELLSKKNKDWMTTVFSLQSLHLGVEHCLYNPCAVESLHTWTHTHTHSSINIDMVWDEPVNSFERKFVPFFSSLSVIKQTNRKIVLKNLAYAFSIKCFKI